MISLFKDVTEIIRELREENNTLNEYPAIYRARSTADSPPAPSSTARGTLKVRRITERAAHITAIVMKAPVKRELTLSC